MINYVNNMKKISCYDCSESFDAETREDVLNQLYGHYMKEHQAVITGASTEEKKAWMERFEKDWANSDAA